MAPRGHEGLDFTPILTQYLFLFTTVLAVVSTAQCSVESLNQNFTFQIAWFIAFVAQAIATANCKCLILEEF
jgi:SHO1 osmosensor